ncbi:MAG: GNAT family N-acetyltransferase [Desulfuromonadales bacterium]|nr:GNAT family N-acetyltransferase [Desulfuromonadales bacterium]
MLPEPLASNYAIDSPGVIGSPVPREWENFLAWAELEGWRVPVRELSVYRNELADCVFVLRDADACPRGFVTVCRHQRSAWIGNLIIDPACRGQGLGRRLFEHAVGHLSARGTATLWLTASQQGRPLYEGCGFREVGRIERWLWRGDSLSSTRADDVRNGDLYSLVRADAAAWGHSRAELLTLLARGGQIFTSGSTAALLQPGSSLRVLGPWLSANLCPRANRNILSRVLDALDGGGEVAVDLLGGSPVGALLPVAGFHPAGETVLMMRGAAGMVRLGEVVALASLGSMG